MLPRTPAPFEISAFYAFAPMDGLQDLRQALLTACRNHGARGTILLAPEGINGTIASLSPALDSLMARIRQLTGLTSLECRTSFAATLPFQKLKVRLKREIVTIGTPLADPRQRVGNYVAPENWNDLISDPDVLVIDTRNTFEHRLGSFAGAIDPGTQSFGEFPAYVNRHLADARHKKIAMFCTGGIRCEKATSYLLSSGFQQVYHLKGGILGYLDRIPRGGSLWHGTCFVFDERIAVGHELRPVEN